MSEPRFTLGWDHPYTEGGATHVTLFEGGVGPLYVVASGHGSDDIRALRDLWSALVERRESRDAVAFVAAEYQSRTGQTLTRP